MADQKKQPPKNSASLSVFEEPSDLSTDDDEGRVCVLKGKPVDAMVITASMIEVVGKTKQQKKPDLSTDDNEGGVHVIKGKAADAMVINAWSMIEVVEKTKQQNKRADTVTLWTLGHCDVISEGGDMHRLTGAKEGQNLTCPRGIAGGQDHRG